YPSVGAPPAGAADRLRASAALTRSSPGGATMAAGNRGSMEGVTVQIGLIGLGKMGGNMAERLRRGGHEVVGYDRSKAAPGDVAGLDGLVQQLHPPRSIWVMVPAGNPTRQTIEDLGRLLQPDDLVIDGGNSKYTDDPTHAELLADYGVGYLDVGVSGGV